MATVARLTIRIAIGWIAIASQALAQSGVINGAAAAGTGNTLGHAPFAAAPAGYSLQTVQQWAASAGNKKVVYVPPEVVGDNKTVNLLRAAFGKMWNHLSWAPSIDIPQDISNGAGLAWALDVNNMWGSNADANWSALANCTASVNASVRPGPTTFCKPFDPNAPVPIPQFVENAANDGPYDNIHNIPANFSDFTSTLSLGPVQYVSTHHDAIVCGPRIIAYRQVALNGQQLWYAFTTDEFNGRDGGSINYTQAPTDTDQRSSGSFNAGPGDSATAVASEWWMQLPNGYFLWGIHGESGQQRGQGEATFAIDPGNWGTSESALQTGHSCITCHAAGVHSATADTQYAGQNGWSSQADLNALYQSVGAQFQAANAAVVKGMSDANDALNQQLINGMVEPIRTAFMLVEGQFTGQQNNTCTTFCDGKFTASSQSVNANSCATMPAR